MATNLPFTNLDFNDVKNNLKTYLQSQDQFKDYNFEGSNINVLLDILAYNTFQNNFYTNMAISEMFLDSAELRDSIVSHAKELNYLPRSRRSAQATTTIQLFPSDAPSSIIIPKRTSFTARCGTETFNFWTDESVLVTPNNGAYIANNVILYEGRYIDEFFNVDGTDTQKFVIRNRNVDTTSIKVYVRDNVNSTLETEYLYKQNIYGVTSTDEVFYLQPAVGDKYEIIFGENIFGKTPINGNVIRVEYRLTEGEIANGINAISATGNIAGYTSTTVVQGRTELGSERETLKSIKYFAPKSIQIQNRAITTRDYEVLIKNEFSDVRSVAVYGGETLFPPQFGRVVVAVDAVSGDGVSTNTRDLISTYLEDKTAIAIEPIVVNARFMNLSVSSVVYYNRNFTTYSPADISSIVTNAITQYSFDNLEEFRKNFNYSDFVTAIDDSDPSISNNDTVITPFIRILPTKNFSNYFILQFDNQLKFNLPYSETALDNYIPNVYSTTFTYAGVEAFLQDDGSGNLNIVRRNSAGSLVIVEKNIGTVDYTTGDVILRYITIQDYPTSGIKVYANTLARKITAPKDRILQIDSSDITVNVVGVRE